MRRFVFALSCIALIAQTAHAATETSRSSASDITLRQPKPISRGLVRTLSLLPVNGPVWFLARKPITGAVNTALQGFGLVAGISGAIALSQISNCGPTDDFLGLCSVTYGLSKGVAYSAVVGGFGMWAISYGITAVRGPHRVEEIREVSSRVRPTINAFPIALTNGGGVGMGGRF